MDFFTSKLGLAGIALALVVAVIGVQTLRLSMANHTIASMKTAQLAAKADVRAHEVTATGISVQAAQALTQAHDDTAKAFAPLLKRIPLDVTAKDDALCSVPDGAVSLWNAAAALGSSGLPGGSGGEPAKPAAVPAPPA